MDFKTDDIFSSEPEKTYSANISLRHRKKTAQFFTPYPVAEFMAKWIVNNPFCKTILDPAIGLGIFIRAIMKKSDNKYRFKGYDIDPDILENAKLLFQTFLNDSFVEFVNQDYIFNDWENKYDGIICNPPYMKSHDYENKNEILKEIRNKLGMSLNGFTNLYTLFMLKSLSQLNPNGRAAYLVPSEFLNSDYGKNVKKYLIKNKTLRYVIIFDFKQNIFKDALTTSSILLFSNDMHSASVEFVTIDSAEGLEELSKQISRYPDLGNLEKTFSYSDLDDKTKWRVYYQKQSRTKFANMIPLSTYGKVVRGIATGDNDYFTFNVRKQKQFNIGEAFLLPCISKATLISSFFFTHDHFRILKEGDKKIYLLNAVDLTDNNLRKYIELGEKTGVHHKFLTSHRNPWYAIENRPPAPIWITVFNRNGLRFVRNEANIRNLTTFHCLYLNLFAMEKADLLFAYLLTDVSKRMFDDNRREYGDGLKKFEPNDLNCSKVINLDVIDKNKQTEISNIYHGFRQSVLCDRPDISYLEELDRQFSKLLEI